MGGGKEAERGRRAEERVYLGVSDLFLITVNVLAVSSFGGRTSEAEKPCPDFYFGISAFYILIFLPVN